ncbi:MAG TPA: 8-amino-7-oxononanoate synthase [Streptosporangiaceae bacterium]|jgi:8-amino-7-oxononanoate synthase
MPDACGPLARLSAAAAARGAAGLRRVLRPRGSEPGRPTDLASNDYLGLATDPRVIGGAVAAARTWGAGATGSRLVTGSTALHTTLERALAEFTGAPAALVFSSGYLANLTAITALAAALGPGTLVVSDAHNHASLIDACRLARARVAVVPHLDLAAVELALASRDEPAALVVTESAFSVGGPLAPLAELHRLTRAHGGLLLIDEAHALGVAGPGGRGAAWLAGLAAEPDVVRTVTLSKSLGAQGGAVLGHAEVIGTLVDTGRGFIFDTGLAPPAAGAALAALRLLAACPSLADRARRQAARLAEVATGAGLPAVPPGAAIVCVPVGDPGAAIAAQRLCADHDVRVGCFRPPSVPPGHSCLRLTARANLAEPGLAAAARALAAVSEHVRVTTAVGRE